MFFLKSQSVFAFIMLRRKQRAGKGNDSIVVEEGMGESEMRCEPLQRGVIFYEIDERGMGCSIALVSANRGTG